ncbi:MAG: arylsulfatase A-like enzyme [Planctomycetota bacterium]|jgi:arylsulfatase A-like enzyme
MRNRILFMVGLLVLFGAGFISCTESEKGAEPRVKRDKPLHVLLIVIDTLRADHLSCYGYWRETSPNIDGLADRGVKFTRSIAQSSWTAPSMVTMMTGQRLSSPRMDVPSDRPTMAGLFKDAGFRTGAWVANELLTPVTGFARGFDRWTGEKKWHMTKPPGRLDGIVDWLEETKDDDTFTWVHFTDPHDPYEPPGSSRTTKQGKITDHQRGLIADAAERQSIEGTIGNQTAFIAGKVGLYDDEIHAVDQKVGTLVAALEKNGNLDDAIIVITSDHGECLWERTESDGRVKAKDKKRGEPAGIQHLLKQTHGDFVYQELVRVPLIIVAPGLERGRVDGTVSESLHLASTILKLADVNVDGVEQMMGGDLFGADAPAGAYTMTRLGEAFIGEDGWKLIWPTKVGAKDFDQELMLFDLNVDPNEWNNLAGEHPERVAELKKRIESRRENSLPKPSIDSQLAVMEANKDALNALGYAEQGHDVIIEDEEEDEEEDSTKE